MRDLINFDKEKSKLVGSVNVRSLDDLVNAVKQLSIIDGLHIQRELKNLNLTRDWYQIFYPHPVVHWEKQDSIYSVEVYERANERTSSGPTRNSSKLLEYLQQYAVKN